MIAKFDSLFIGPVDVDAVGCGGVPVNERRFPDKHADGVLCGAPGRIVEHLKALENRYPGLDRVSVGLSAGVPKSVALEQLERFLTEVMPAFAKAKTAEPAVA